MSRWLRIDSDLLNDAGAQRLSAAVFKRAFMAAIRGEPSPLGAFVRPTTGRPSPAEWAIIRNRIYARDDYACRYCGERGGRLECDHVEPLALGGSNDDTNLVTACYSCNRSKGPKRLSDWRGRAAHQDH